MARPGRPTRYRRNPSPLSVRARRSLTDAGVTFLAWQTSHSAVEARKQQRFARESERVIELVRERLQHYEDALLSAVAAMQVSGGAMSRAQWRLYAGQLNLAERYPGASGIGIIHHVDEGRLAGYLDDRRKERPEGFSMHPEHRFDVHLPIAYIEPEAANAAAVGLDVAFEDHRREAALRARRTGTTQISGPIVLVQDAGRTPGFLFYAPYHRLDGRSVTGDDESADPGADLGADASADPSADARQASFSGLVYVPLVVRSLVEGILSEETRQVHFSILDGGTALYSGSDGQAGAGEPPAKPSSFSRTVDLPVYGRTWTFDIHATSDFDDSFGTNQPLVVLLSGLTIDAMLFGLFLLMSRSNRRTLALAERMTGDLCAQALDIAETNRDLESFAHVVSHDLKTPIRGMQDLTEFLEEDLGTYLASDEADPEVGRNLRRLRDQARKSDTLITGILDYSVVGIHDEIRSLVDGRRVVEDIRESLGVRPEQLVIEGELPIFHTGAVRFGQVLANLVGNAFKYHHDPERAVTRVRAERCGRFHRFHVVDDGPGIEPRFHERVFEAFTTLERGKRIDSSGIGLSIVRKSVELNGGEVGVDSSPGHGADFHFTWPTEADPADLQRAA